MDLKNVNTKQLILELSTRPEVKDILVTGDQEFKVKIGATGYEYEGPYKIISSNPNSIKTRIETFFIYQDKFL